MAKFYFYDIESLDNVFTLCNFREADNEVDVFILTDDPNLMNVPDFHNELTARVHKENPNFKGGIVLYNLATPNANRQLARMFGLSDARMVTNKSDDSSYDKSFRPVCTTDTDVYNENVHPFLMGYNSYNYDTTMLAQYLYTAFANDGTNRVMPVTAAELRVFNDMLFDSNFKNRMPSALTREYTQTGALTEPNYQDPRWRIRKNMLLTGRHLDVAKLNEKQSRVGLKRLLGMRGLQILESNKLGTGVDHINSTDELYELIAYNVSDCVNLCELFHHKFYQAQFTLKKGLLETYPELIYEKRPGAYAPDIGPSHVRRDRLTIDSTSAQFATKCLCPYDYLKDINTVSYWYPSERKVAELKAKGIEVKRVNVLEEAKKFFEANFHQPEIRAEFQKVYDFYKSIEGKNFNDSSQYKRDHADDNGRIPEQFKALSLADINQKIPMYYYDGNGQKTSCFVTFSTGGIHGAEYNKVLFDADYANWEAQMADLAEVQRKFPDPLDLRTAKEVKMDDGRVLPYKNFLNNKATIKAMNATHPANRARLFYKSLADKEPTLFKLDKNGLKLNPAYTYTSCDLANHEDFKSYYPNLLRMLSAFWNEGLGVDRYGEIFENKEKYGKLMKDKTLPESERELYGILREGTKLILNSASGAGDTKSSIDSDYSSPIQMNNVIISMRIIGQLFTWRIGQAQAIHGAKITSTNTDGLYSALEVTLNNAILEKESADIGVDIEPEPVYLVSKDANNRFEMDPVTGDIISASGGSLACRQDTDPTKALSHPAILDWALTEYLVVASLRYKNLGIEKPFNEEIGRSILESARSKFELTHRLRMYQNVIASSVGSVTYLFATKDGASGTPIILQHYNRVFIVKDKTPGSVHLHQAAARAITPATKNKRARDGEKQTQHDPLAMDVLRANNAVRDIKFGTEATVKKVTGINPEWYAVIENRNLELMPPDEQIALFESIDQDKYLQMLKSAYEDNWRNRMPEGYVAPEDTASPSETSDTEDTEANTPDVKTDVSADLSTENVDIGDANMVQSNIVSDAVSMQFEDESGKIVATMSIEKSMADGVRYYMQALGLTAVETNPQERKN